MLKVSKYSHRPKSSNHKVRYFLNRYFLAPLPVFFFLRVGDDEEVITFQDRTTGLYKEKAVRLSSNCLTSCDPPGSLCPRRCNVSFSELCRADLADSRMSHAHTSMFFTGMQFRHCKVNKIPPISNASER